MNFLATRNKSLTTSIPSPLRRACRRMSNQAGALEQGPRGACARATRSDELRCMNRSQRREGVAATVMVCFAILLSGCSFIQLDHDRRSDRVMNLGIRGIPCDGAIEVVRYFGGRVPSPEGFV